MTTKNGEFLLIAGPCVIESQDMLLEVAGHLAEVARRHAVRPVFKASYDKANRTAAGSYRGPGLAKGLDMLARVRDETGLPVLSDVHEVCQVAPAAEALDYLQIPAFLCRQTDLVVAAAATMKPVNIKKGQFLAPEDMRYVAEKAASTGNRDITLTERGACMGYHNLVVDFRAFNIMAQFGYPVIFDATHSVQIPSRGGVSAGHREYVRPLARAAAAYGIDGLFLETHPDPPAARSDAANCLPLDQLEDVVREALAVRAAART